MRLPSLSFLAQAFFDAARRFPATLLCAIVGVGAIMTALENNGDDNVIKLWLMGQLGLALCTGLTVLAESRSWPRLYNMLAQVVGLGLLVLYYFLLDMDSPAMDTVHLPRYLGLLATAHLLVAMAPYLNRFPVADFWEYNKQLFANFVVGAVYTLILFAGLSLALLAVNELFKLNINGKMYGHLFALLAGVFNTVFFLFHFPRTFAFSDVEKAYNVVFKNLCQYILIPIVGLYFLILYAYSAKILVTWDLPQGWVSSLVLGFSVAGIFTYLINYLLPEYTDNVVVKAYRKWFWWVLLPMVGLLFVAIGRRIADYGITENRFYVAHAGVWLLVMCGYFLWSKTDNIKFIPISLALFILVAVLGPFSAFNVAQRNQMSILHRLLEENGRFENGKIRPGGTPVTGEAATRIMSGLHYLQQRDALDRVEPWLPIPLQALPDSAEHKSLANRLAAWMNVETGIDTYAEELLAVYPRQPISNGNVAGFRYFHRLEIYDTQKAATPPPAGQQVWLSDDAAKLLLKTENNTAAVDSFDLTPLMQGWAAADSVSTIDLTLENPVFELKGKKYKARFYLQEARFNRKTWKIESLNGLFFVK